MRLQMHKANHARLFSLSCKWIMRVPCILTMLWQVRKKGKPSNQNRLLPAFWRNTQREWVERIVTHFQSFERHPLGVLLLEQIIVLQLDIVNALLESQHGMVETLLVGSDLGHGVAEVTVKQGQTEGQDHRPHRKHGSHDKEDYRARLQRHFSRLPKTCLCPVS